jgi:hypothetical protein
MLFSANSQPEHIREKLEPGAPHCES